MKASGEDLCPHGIQTSWHCGLCSAEKAPKCKHGNPFYCGLCWQETGNGRVPIKGFPKEVA